MSIEVLSDTEVATLQAAAERVAENAYAPYSKFRVGAALRLANGAIVTGANVENVSYGLTICAERSAIMSAVAQFGPGIRVTAACVTNLNSAASPPCGACRQVLAEFMDGDASIIFSGDSGQQVSRLSELLPFGFKLEGSPA